MTEAALADRLHPAYGDDRRSLKAAIRRAERTRRARAAALVAPLFVYLIVVFALPIAFMLYRAVDNPEVVDVLPRVSRALEAWDGAGVPGEGAYAALVADLKEARRARTIAEPAQRLNYEISGFRSLIMRTARKVARIETPPPSWKDKLIAIDERWAKRDYWAAVKRTAQPYTAFYLLSALDHRINVEGAIVPAQSRPRR